jgi:hypothetical protein
MKMDALMSPEEYARRLAQWTAAELGEIDSIYEERKGQDD